MNCKVCEDPSCKNPSISFFRFPKETSRCKNWAEICNLNSHDESNLVQCNESSVVNSDQFDPKDRAFDEKKKELLQNAMPIFFPPPKSPEEPKITHEEFIRRKAFKRRLVKNFCRLCAKRYRNLTNIFSFKGKALKLENKLDFLPIVINKVDILPLRICHHCILKLSQFYDFIMSCVAAEKKLKTMVDMINFEARNKPDCTKKPDQEKLKQEPTDTIEVTEDSSDTENSSDTGSDDAEFKMYCNGNVKQAKFELIDRSKMKKVEPKKNFIRLNQCFKVINHTKKIDFSQNISFKHDYSDMIFKNVPSLDPNLQIEIPSDDLITEPKFSCNICSETFKTDDNLNFHMLSHNEEEKNAGELICKTCNEKFDSETLLNEHIIVHTTKNYRCPICEINFPSLAYFEQHNKKSHRVLIRIRSAQPSIDLGSLDYNLMSANYKTHEPHKSIRIWKPRKSVKCLKVIYKPKAEKKCVCNYCDKVFINRQALMIHSKCHHKGKSPYHCRLCNKNFRSRTSLRRHRTVHSDKRRFLCQNCGVTFNQMDALKNHMKIHTGERPFFL